MKNYKYKAFISYSHSDVKAASWLQRELESYRVPRRLLESLGPHRLISKRLGLIFRDRDELSAGSNLSESLRTALASSEYLIVICSSAACKSQWVDLEIKEFKRLQSQQNILCLVVEDDASIRTSNGQIEPPIFPRALRSDYHEDNKTAGFEPIAADIRKNADGKKLAKLKIISALIGVGLSDLIQRDAQRRQRNLVGLSLASALGMIMFASISYIALEARSNEELRRGEAEGLIEFMLSDLRDKLDEVGRLDVLDAVGEKAIEYYSKVELNQHTESSLGRRARALHLLGEVNDLEGDLESAHEAFTEAFRSTNELLERSSQDEQRIFNHAQSVFWLGYLDWRLGNIEQAHDAFLDYLRLAERLVNINPQNSDWQKEVASANLNLGVYLLEAASPKRASAYFEKSAEIYQNILRADSNNYDARWLLAQSTAYQADTVLAMGKLSDALNFRTSELEIYSDILENDSENQEINLSVSTTLQARAIILLQMGLLEASIDDFIAAKTINEKLHALDPTNTFALSELVGANFRLGEALNLFAKHEQARPLFDEARVLTSKLLALSSEVVDWQHYPALIKLYEIKYLVSQKREGEQVVVFAQVLDSAKQLANSNPGVQAIQELLFEAYFYAAKATLQRGDAIMSVSLMNDAIAAVTTDIDAAPLLMKAYLREAYIHVGKTSEAERLTAQLSTSDFNHPEFLVNTER